MSHAMLISTLLNSGRENALTLRELVALTGEDERTVRRRIHAERKGGALIMADCLHGYFLPEDPSDVQRFIRSMNGRAREVAAISRAAEIALSEMTGQTRMDGV